MVEPEAARGVREERGRVSVWEHDCVVCRVDSLWIQISVDSGPQRPCGPAEGWDLLDRIYR